MSKFSWVTRLREGYICAGEPLHKSYGVAVIGAQIFQVPLHAATQYYVEWTNRMVTKEERRKVFMGSITLDGGTLWLQTLMENLHVFILFDMEPPDSDCRVGWDLHGSTMPLTQDQSSGTHYFLPYNVCTDHLTKSKHIWREGKILVARLLHAMHGGCAGVIGLGLLSSCWGRVFLSALLVVEWRFKLFLARFSFTWFWDVWTKCKVISTGRFWHCGCECNIS